MTTRQHTMREAWLINCATRLNADFRALDAELPLARIRFSCGWPRGSRKAIGQCWSAYASADDHFEIFVSPVLAESRRVADVLLHELIHVATTGTGHGPEFRRLALALGLTPPMTATTASPRLNARLDAIIAQIGPYPHAALTDAHAPTQTTRLIKAMCPDCGYTIRLSRQWLNCGLPTCVCGGIFVQCDQFGLPHGRRDD